MTFNLLMLSFAFAFMGCVLAIPVVTRVAVWSGAIDAPDKFRRIHKGTIPRMGGIGLAFGLALSLSLVANKPSIRAWSDFPTWARSLSAVALAGLMVLAVGILDDKRELRPRAKLLGQLVAVLVLYMGGVRIDSVDVFGLAIPLSYRWRG